MVNNHKNQANILARECISTALIQLLKEKTLSSISISELTRKAGVSRMTYYRNYKSKEDIFISQLDDIMNTYNKEFKNRNYKGEFFDIDNLVHCFSYFEKHRDFINVLFQSDLGHLFLCQLCKYVLNTWYYPSSKDLNRYYTLQAFAGSLYNVYIAWSVNGSHEKPESMACILHDIYCTKNTL